MTFEPVNRIRPYLEALERDRMSRPPPTSLPPARRRESEPRQPDRIAQLARDARDAVSYHDFRAAVESLAKVGGMQSARALGGLLRHEIDYGDDPWLRTYMVCNLLLNLGGRPGAFQSEIAPAVELNPSEKRAVRRFVRDIADGDCFNEEVSGGARMAIFDRFVRWKFVGGAVWFAAVAASMVTGNPAETIHKAVAELPWRLKFALGFKPDRFECSLPRIIHEFSRGTNA